MSYRTLVRNTAADLFDPENLQSRSWRGPIFFFPKKQGHSKFRKESRPWHRQAESDSRVQGQVSSGLELEVGVNESHQQSPACCLEH